MDIIEQQNLIMIRKKLKNCEQLEKQIFNMQNKHNGNRSILEMTQSEIAEFNRTFPHKEAEAIKRQFSEACEDLYQHLKASKLLDTMGE